ncbi:M50 family metallopeptidase [Ruegeria sp. 6PALISEP08]|uniref:M50 family metallopeptidase n=1 Tax=Ruegeria sp. 6PALISEP08 TaxID=1225660 RepID=UPI00067EFA90|nr:M50 family metallopeptidase [Ruegeria sp. 6PALISEP08]
MQGQSAFLNLLKGHWQLILITGSVFLLWNTSVVIPLKILTVFLHELSHAVTILLTGGSVESFSISPQQGGMVIGRGGNRFLSLSAGYLGSLVLGMVLLILALQTKADRAVLAVFGGVMCLVAVLYIRDLFALVFCVGTGAAMIATAWYLRREVSDLVLRVIGLTSVIYVPFDIFDDTIRRSGMRSDAFMLAEEFGGTTMMWGGVWLVLSGIAIYLCLRYCLGPDSNLHFGQATR